jgi:hypothetical protein
MNKVKIIFLAFLLNSFAIQAEEIVDREFCYFGAASAFSHADKALGFVAKFAFPMQKGFYFVSQATYLPPILTYQYKELRYQLYLEIIPFKIKRFEFFAHTGFDWGMWTRNYTSPYQSKMDSYFHDESLLFGGGINYNIKGIQLFADYKYYPTIFSHHSSFGIKVKVFENKEMRKAYFKYIRRKMDVSPAQKS